MLPDNPNQPWPPKAWAPIQADIVEHAAWWSGDPDKLTAVYGSTTSDGRSSRRLFWGRRRDDKDTDRQRLHIPVASDIAQTAADLLFGADVDLTIPDAHGDNANPEAKATEARLYDLLDVDGTPAKLLEAAEVAAALGGAWLRPVWDRNLVDRPIVHVLHPDCAVPEFRFGEVTAVTFWSVLTVDDKKVWRHLERHEHGTPGQPGTILHGLYVGSIDKLGHRVSMDAHPDTAPIVEAEITLPPGIDMAARYLPNVKPNRKHRGVPVGRSDLAGVEPLMDALDETWSSWMRDIRLGKLRIIVPDQFLDRPGGRGKGAAFDPDREIFAPLNVTVKADGTGSTITPIEFKLRVDEHARTAMELYQRCVTSAGYSPQSFGLEGDGGQQTATEVDAKEGRSEQTIGKKRRHVRRGVEDICEQLLILDKVFFQASTVPFRPRLGWPGVDANMRDMASTLNLINLAKAASVETRVGMLHPDWDQTEVLAEAERIRLEEGVGVADPTGFGQ